MISTPGKSQSYKGSSPSGSPNSLGEGVFSLCSGGVPKQGSFARVPGKVLRETGFQTGGILSIAQLGNLLVIQRYTGIEIIDIINVIPDPENDYTYDNEGFLVVDNFGIPVLN